MDQPRKGLLKQAWSKHAPWYVKVARVVTLSTAGFFGVVTGLGQLPGEKLPQERQQALAEFFGAGLDLDQVRLHSSTMAEKYLSFTGAEAATYGEAIMIQQKYQESLPGNDLGTQYVLAHELAHTWQAQHHGLMFSLRSLKEKLANIGQPLEKLYFYSLEEGKSFDDYGIEQQASIIADYYFILHGREPVLLQNKVESAERDRLYRDVLKGVVGAASKPPTKPATPELAI